MALARFFAWLDRVLGVELRAGPSAGASGATHRGASSAFVSASGGPVMVHAPRSTRAPLEMAALLSVDGGGQFLLCGAERLTLGHLRAGKADLGFLADVGALHATLVRTDSLHAGPGWRIVPSAGEKVTVDGQPVPEAGCRLASGAHVRLGENLEFCLHVPDPASASAVLELLHGAECAGARRIVLLALGAGGRVRIGAALAHHVRVPGLEFELGLEWDGSSLLLCSEEPLAGDFAGQGGPAQGGAGESFRLPFPPCARLALTCGKARGSRPPFGLFLEPVERFEPGNRGA